MIKTIMIFSLLLISAGCATPNLVAEDLLNSNNDLKANKSQHSLFVFLLDGVSYQLLNEKFKQGQLSNIKNFFAPGDSAVPRALVQEPVLESPSTIEFLSGLGFADTKLFSNFAEEKGQWIDLREPQNCQKLDLLMKGQDLLSRVSAKGFKVLSLDPCIRKGANVNWPQFTEKRFSLLAESKETEFDLAMIEDLTDALEKIPPEDWPTLTFLRFKGFKKLSQTLGANSEASLKHLEKIDRKLSRLFSLLKKNDQRSLTLLTSTYGFAYPLTDRLDFKNFIELRFPGGKYILDGRFFMLREEKDRKRSAEVANEIFNAGAARHVSYNTVGGFGSATRDLQTTIPPSSKSLTYLESIHHSQANNSFVVVAMDGVKFSPGLEGETGGGSDSEKFVPFLVRGQLIKLPPGDVLMSTALKGFETLF